MEILEPHGQRFEAALELLLEGHSFTFDGVQFSLSSEGYLVVCVESSFWMENINERTALNDLQRAKNTFDYLARESSSFSAIAQYQPLLILINYHGHGGEVELARLVDGKMSWAKGLPLTQGAV
jgi:hypothetical protein